MAGRPGVLALVCAGLVLTGPVRGAMASAADASAEAHVDFLHLQANEGESAGGHAAFRIGDWTYHFQHDRGLLRLRRDDWERFHYAYRSLQNRGIRLTRIAVDADTRERLRRAFQRRYRVGERRLTLLADLERDAQLLAALLAEARDADAGPGYALAGAGFFRAGAGAAPTRVAGLRGRIESRYGPGFLAGRRRALRASLAALDPSPPPPAALAPESGRLPGLAEPFSRRYAEHWSGLAALALLDEPRPLAPEALIADSPLDPSERSRLGAHADALEESLLRLAASPRPDWGSAFLLGLARLAAMERSLATDRLWLLDAAPDAAERLRVDARRREALPAVLGEARDDLGAARRRALRSRSWRESEWSALEVAASRVGQLRRAREGAPWLRVLGGAALPEGRARVTRLPRPALDASALARHLHETRDAVRRYRAALENEQGYHLITRNCVSEIFRTIEWAFADGEGQLPQQVRAESERRLGGHVDPVAQLAFVPFVASRHVAGRYRVVEQRWLPSYRRFQLGALREREASLWVALRESNTLSSSLYRRSDDDGFFLFFTDGPAALRPLLGAGNLVGALGWSGLGLVRLPLDRGRSLRAGLEGALFSLPELVFVNLRKGSNEYVPPHRRPPS